MIDTFCVWSIFLVSFSGMIEFEMEFTLDVRLSHNVPSAIGQSVADNTVLSFKEAFSSKDARSSTCNS